jgi:hypothetical protein
MQLLAPCVLQLRGTTVWRLVASAFSAAWNAAAGAAVQHVGSNAVSYRCLTLSHFGKRCRILHHKPFFGFEGVNLAQLAQNFMVALPTYICSTSRA